MGFLPDSDLDLKGKLRSGPQSLGKLAGILKPGAEAGSAPRRGLRHGHGKDLRPPGERRCQIFRHHVQGGNAQGRVYVVPVPRSHPCRKRRHQAKADIYGKTLIIDRLNADLAYHGGVLDIRSAEVSAGDLAVRMQGTVDQARGFDAELAIESSGAGKTLSFLTSLPLEGGVAVQGRLTGALNAPVVEGTFEAGPVTVRRIQFDHVGGKMRYQATKISLESVEILRQSSHYVFDGSADFSGGEPAYSARLKVIQSDVVSIVALFYEPLPLTAVGERRAVVPG